MKLADRLNDIEPFRVVEVLTRAKQLEAQGVDIVHLEAGEPDFATAEPICQAAQQALSDGHTYYSPAAGLAALRETISKYYQSDYNLDIDPRRIMVTPGASGALLLVSALLMNPGQSLLMTDPGYPCNRHFLRLVEAQAQLLPVAAAERYQLQLQHVQQHWQTNTCGVMAASPSNPTGTLMDMEQLKAISAFVQEKRGHLILDEIYQGLVYEQQAESVLGINNEAFVINSFSKYFGMTGWRLGWLVAPEAAVDELEKLAQNLFISMSTFSQYGALAGFLPVSREILDQRKDIFKQRRDFLLPALRELGFDIQCKPDGGFYLYADISGFNQAFGKNSQEFCHFMLEKQGIALTPGIDFGHYKADQHIRFSFTTDINQLEKAVERLSKLLC